MAGPVKDETQLRRSWVTNKKEWQKERGKLRGRVGLEILPRILWQKCRRRKGANTSVEQALAVSLDKREDLDFQGESTGRCSGEEWSTGGT